MIVPVTEPFRPFAEPALARLRYLYPAAGSALTACSVTPGFSIFDTRFCSKAILKMGSSRAF